MSKFRRFLGRISAESRLKIHYFRNKSQKSPIAGGSLQTPLLPAVEGFVLRPSLISMI